MVIPPKQPSADEDLSSDHLGTEEEMKVEMDTIDSEPKTVDDLTEEEERSPSPEQPFVFPSPMSPSTLPRSTGVGLIRTCRLISLKLPAFSALIQAHTLT